MRVGTPGTPLTNPRRQKRFSPSAKRHSPARGKDVRRRPVRNPAKVVPISALLLQRSARLHPRGPTTQSSRRALDAQDETNPVVGRRLPLRRAATLVAANSRLVNPSHHGHLGLAEPLNESRTADRICIHSSYIIAPTTRASVWHTTRDTGRSRYVGSCHIPFCPRTCICVRKKILGRGARCARASRLRQKLDAQF